MLCVRWHFQMMFCIHLIAWILERYFAKTTTELWVFENPICVAGRIDTENIFPVLQGKYCPRKWHVDLHLPNMQVAGRCVMSVLTLRSLLQGQKFLSWSLTCLTPPCVLLQTCLFDLLDSWLTSIFFITLFKRTESFRYLNVRVTVMNGKYSANREGWARHQLQKKREWLSRAATNVSTFSPCLGYPNYFAEVHSHSNLPFPSIQGEEIIL